MTHKPALKFSSMSYIIPLQVRWTGEFDNSFRFFRIHLWVETSIFPLKRKIVADYPKYSEPRKSSKVSDWWTRKEIQSFEIRRIRKYYTARPHPNHFLDSFEAFGCDLAIRTDVIWNKNWTPIMWSKFCGLRDRLTDQFDTWLGVENFHWKYMYFVFYWCNFMIMNAKGL